MENQHRKITGYRELDETEIALMNKIKALGIAIEGVINEIIEHQSRQRRFAHNEDVPQATVPTRSSNSDSTPPSPSAGARWAAATCRPG